MKKMLIILFGLFFYAGLNGQYKTVSGRVTTLKKFPVHNALIIVKSNNQKIFTDSLGWFLIQCLPTDKLIVSAKGFNERNVRIKEIIKYAFVNLRLKSNGEVMRTAVGYGYVQDQNRLYGMSSRDERSFDFARYQNIYDALTGNFPGLQVIDKEVVIRSSSSGGKGRLAPALLIVDGREVSKTYFGFIVPSDISQINVLKDASAAIYGSRGANGVVIIETRRGPGLK